MFEKILIANRGEIACRIINTARKLGISTVAVYSDADREALHCRCADQSVYIGASPASESYLDGQKIIAAAKQSGANAVHPGYGFLSENPDFVDALTREGITFIGPGADAIRAMGLKDAAKDLMNAAGVPVVPGYHGENQDLDHLRNEAQKIGFSVLIKARAGGGGKGMRLVKAPGDFAASLAAAQREAKASFGDDHVLIEKFIASPRHIEVQVFGDSHGNFVHLYERDCSLQRRHQKVIEEAPAPGMTPAFRAAITDAAIRAARSINYLGAGTVEFIVDGSGPLDPKKFWFMEMNTRLQVEHPVTEAITGIDLVEWQIRVAAGGALPLQQDEILLHGHAFEARIYAEDPSQSFLPSSGQIAHLTFGPGRVDTGVRSGDSVTPFYDPMIAKLTTHGVDRTQALAKLNHGLTRTHIVGPANNIAFLAGLAQHTGFAAGEVDTGLIDRDLASLTQTPAPDPLAQIFAVIATLNVTPDAARLAWRHWGGQHHRVRFQDGMVVSVQISNTEEFGLCVSTDDRQLTNITRTGTQVAGIVDGLSVTGDVFKSGGQISVNVNGATQCFDLHDPMNQMHSDATDTDSVRAPMTGVVRVINFAPNDTVSRGDPLLVLEAMKMEHTLTAPRDGEIAEIACAAGDAVDDGAILVRFATDE